MRFRSMSVEENGIIVLFAPAARARRRQAQGWVHLVAAEAAVGWDKSGSAAAARLSSPKSGPPFEGCRARGRGGPSLAPRACPTLRFEKHVFSRAKILHGVAPPGLGVGMALPRTTVPSGGHRMTERSICTVVPTRTLNQSQLCPFFAKSVWL